ncbi:MAG TPA: alpha/beta hydrolase [Acidimicrobiia bacterium]|jgi:acetyl esterase/lipase
MSTASVTSDQLHPEIAAHLEAFPVFDFSSLDLAEVRGQTRQTFLEGVQLSDDVERVDHVVDADLGIVVRIHRAKSAHAPLPCVFSIHGGGYILGSRDMDDPRFDRWCTSLPCVGASVEYRLAPEVPFPGPLEDCHAALQWLVAHADELGVDAARIGVSGVSAGGGLAAALALLARERGEITLRFQLLEAPMLDDRQQTPSSRLEGLPVWSRQSNEFGWRSYLGERYGRDDVPSIAAPARCDDLAGLPPAFVAVGTMDGFRDEDVDYAMRLNQAGVPTELHVYPGAPHGFQMFPQSSVTQQAQRDVDDWLGRQLARLQ